MLEKVARLKKFFGIAGECRLIFLKNCTQTHFFSKRILLVLIICILQNYISKKLYHQNTKHPIFNTRGKRNLFGCLIWYSKEIRKDVIWLYNIIQVHCITQPIAASPTKPQGNTIKCFVKIAMVSEVCFSEEKISIGRVKN